MWSPTLIALFTLFHRIFLCFLIWMNEICFKQYIYINNVCCFNAIHLKFTKGIFHKHQHFLLLYPSKLTKHYILFLAVKEVAYKHCISFSPQSRRLTWVASTWCATWSLTKTTDCCMWVPPIVPAKSDISRTDTEQVCHAILACNGRRATVDIA